MMSFQSDGKISMPALPAFHACLNEIHSCSERKAMPQLAESPELG